MKRSGMSVPLQAVVGQQASASFAKRQPSLNDWPNANLWTNVCLTAKRLFHFGIFAPY